MSHIILVSAAGLTRKRADKILRRLKNGGYVARYKKEDRSVSIYTIEPGRERAQIILDKLIEEISE